MAETKPNTSIRLLAVGDKVVGKSTMLALWSKGRLELNGASFTDSCHALPHHGKTLNVGLKVVEGGPECYERLRCIKYIGVDIFILLYSVGDRDSFDRITNLWIPEIRQYTTPHIPIILVGNKIDLRYIGDENPSDPLVTYREGLSLARQHDVSFVETSTHSDIGVKDLLDKSLTLAVAWRQSGKRRKQTPVYSPPYVPPPKNPPYIHIAESTFASDMAALVNEESDADVLIHFGGDEKMYAHRVILCSASVFFCRLFRVPPPPQQGDEHDVDMTPFSIEDIDKGCVRGVSKLWEESTNGETRTLVHIRLDDTAGNISSRTLPLILRFMYTGQLRLPDALSEEEVSSLATLADIFDLPHLSEMVSSGVECLRGANLAIERYPSSRHWRATKLFVENTTFSDVKFIIEGIMVPAHKVLLRARSLYMVKMFGGQFAETSKDEIPMPDVKMQDFLLLLDFLYSDKCSRRPINVCSLLQLSDQLGVSRLKHMCERHLANNFTSVSDTHNASQLKDYIRYVICTHYDASFDERWRDEDFSQEDLDYFKEHRYPPTSHLRDMEEFKLVDEFKRVGEDVSIPVKKGKKCSVM